jgi:hypothetical protein
MIGRLVLRNFDVVSAIANTAHAPADNAMPRGELSGCGKGSVARPARTETVKK